MVQKIEFDCKICPRLKECDMRDYSNYCPLRDTEITRALGTTKNRYKPIPFWGSSNR